VSDGQVASMSADAGDFAATLVVSGDVGPDLEPAMGAHEPNNDGPQTPYLVCPSGVEHRMQCATTADTDNGSVVDIGVEGRPLSQSLSK